MNGGSPIQAVLWLEWGSSRAGCTWDIALKGRGFQPRRNPSSTSTLSFRAEHELPNDGHAKSRDPKPVDIQQRPDRESSEI
jgi:hypothetical protein